MTNQKTMSWFSALITGLMAQSSLAAGLPFTLNFSGFPASAVSGVVCLNAAGPLTCQKFSYKPTQGGINQPTDVRIDVTTNIPGKTYPNAGIKLTSPGYLSGGSAPNAKGMNTFSITSSSAAVFKVSAVAPDGTLSNPYGVANCQSPSYCPAGVYLFTTADSDSAIQTTIDSIYTSFAKNPLQAALYDPLSEWSKNRFALLFSPGTYNVNLKVNYYTQVLGLGQTPAEVKLTNLYVDNLCHQGDVGTCITLGALNNFWRGVENITFNPQTCRIPTGGQFHNSKCIIWNVSQASPMRNVVVNGDLMLNSAGCFDAQGQCNGPAGSGGERPCPGTYNQDFACGAGYASGGFMANTTVSGDVHSIAQQQWFTRDSSFSTWYDTLWDMVFLNTTGTVIATPYSFNLTGTWADIPITNRSAPAVNPKPYLLQVGNVFKVKADNVVYELDNLVRMNPSNTDVNAINTALATKPGLVIEPGIYSLSQPINVPTGKFVLGIGLPELQCVSGTSCLNVSGKQATVAGLMLAAGYTSSDALLYVDHSMGQAASAADATTLMDIFCRVGEANKVRQGNGPTVKNCVHIDADYVVGDDLWLWRADHDLASSIGPNGQSLKPPANLVQWNQDVTEHGLLVDGQNVSMYGLFSEHHGASNVLWNGDGGTTYFYQSELNYEAPNTWNCLDPVPVGFNGCPSYMLGPQVTKHHGYGLTAYTYFQNNVILTAGFLSPAQAGIVLTNLVGRYLNATTDGVIPAPTNSGLGAMISNYTPVTFGHSAKKGNGTDMDKTPAYGEWIGQ